MTALKLLDCTFRDGGYYNSWDFDPQLTAEYLRALSSAKVDAVEIGFRMFPQEQFHGAFAYSTDEFLKGLPLPKGVLIGVMVNASDLLKHPAGVDKALSLLFREKAKSPVGLVRIAAHFRDIEACGAIAKGLKRLGYQVGFNLMQSTGKSKQTLAAAARTVAGWKSVDVLYFADSLGNMDGEGIVDTLSALREGWGGPIGVHAHNSLDQGVANTLTAIAHGAAWVDGTILGMGRGPGNAQTEHLLIELERKGIRESDMDPVFSLALGSFAKLQKQYGWGPNLLYYLAAVHGIHPTYVQTMLGKGQYDRRHIIAAIESLRKSDASSFTTDHLEQALFSTEGSGKGGWSAAGFAEGRRVLIVAAGPSLKNHAAALKSFIRRDKPLVLCLNAKGVLAPEEVDAYVACHKVSLLMDAEQYRLLKRPVVAPREHIPAAVLPKLGKAKLLDYGMRVQKGVFQPGEKGCVIPVPLAAAYALALAEAAGARELLLAGFDGYGAADARQHEMNLLLKLYLSRKTALPLRSMTPTTYEVPQGSIYAPRL